MKLRTYLIQLLIFLYCAKRYRYYHMAKQPSQKNKISFLQHFSKITEKYYSDKTINTYESVSIVYDLLWYWYTFCIVCSCCLLSVEESLRNSFVSQGNIQFLHWSTRFLCLINTSIQCILRVFYANAQK